MPATTRPCRRVGRAGRNLSLLPRPPPGVTSQRGPAPNFPTREMLGGAGTTREIAQNPSSSSPTSSRARAAAAAAIRARRYAVLMWSLWVRYPRRQNSRRRSGVCLCSMFVGRGLEYQLLLTFFTWNQGAPDKCHTQQHPHNIRARAQLTRMRKALGSQVSRRLDPLSLAPHDLRHKLFEV